MNLTTLYFLTRFSFVNIWVILLLFPAMRSQASWLQDTSLFVFTYESASFPIRTEIIRIIVKKLGFSSEILPIVSIVTLSFIVFFVEWTPLSLKIELIKIWIFLHEMDDSSLDIFLRMSKRTIFSILTLRKMFWKFCTEFSLVFFYVIKAFYPIMRKFTRIFLGTFISLWEFTQIRRVLPKLSPSIFNCMIECLWLCWC